MIYKKIILLFSLYIIFGFSFQKEEISFVIEGNPPCLTLNKTYTAKSVIPSKYKNRNISFAGVAISIEVLNNKNKTFKLTVVSKNAYVSVIEYNIKTKKSTILKKINFKIC